MNQCLEKLKSKCEEVHRWLGGWCYHLIKYRPKTFGDLLLVQDNILAKVDQILAINLWTFCRALLQYTQFSVCALLLLRNFPNSAVVHVQNVNFFINSRCCCSPTLLLISNTEAYSTNVSFWYWFLIFLIIFLNKGLLIFQQRT